jgi:triosephosphate isomerase
MRRKLLVGNWKMNRNPVEADALAGSLRKLLSEATFADIVVAPPFLSIPAVVSRLRHSNIEVGAQNLHAEASGAFTGEISGEMLKTAGVAWCIVGHSERRQIFGEDDRLVSAKVQACLRAGLRPILCVGETLAERDAGQVDAVVSRQVEAVFQKLNADIAATITIAYEPVWAIGTGRTASPEQAQEVHATIRGLLAAHFPSFVARTSRILYGGSVKGSNARSLLGQADVDGALVGGASLVPEDFAAIVEGAR